jgi:serine/threonine protein kinase
VKSTSRGTIALKLLDPTKCNLARSEREINALIKCDSQYIAKLYEYGDFTANGGGKYYFTLEEFLAGGTLAQQIAGGTPNVPRIMSYAISLVRALEHLKAAGLVHRDIKPDNIMFRSDRKSPVLVDFGLVRDLSESSLTQTWLPQGPGTPLYASPEQLNNEKYLIGWRSDQFSLGVVLSTCLTGKHPFRFSGGTVPAAIEAVARRMPLLEAFKDEMKALRVSWIIRMVDPWPVRRYLISSGLLKAIKEES